MHTLNFLRCLVALAGHEYDIARLGLMQGPTDCLRAIGDLITGGRAGASRDNLRTNRGRILAPRVVVRHQDRIGLGTGHSSHRRPLAVIALTAAAKHDTQPPARMRPQGLQCGLQRCGRMGVIHHRQSPIRERETLHTARHSG